MSNKSLSPAEMKELVELAVRMGVIAPPEAKDEKPDVLIDKYALQKLFWNTKFREAKKGKKMPILTVRCERNKKVWHAVVKGSTAKKVHAVKQMVLTNVSFVNKTGLETKKEKEYVGCGTYRTSEINVYSGFAEGQLVPMDPQGIPQGARKLTYDRDEGVFRDSCSGEVINMAAYLVLLEDCHHAYIPMPAPAVESKSKKQKG